jgi:hypothetical protein
MTRYILIDQNSGFIWGEAEAADECEACRKVDETLGEYGREYAWHSPTSAARRSGKDGYLVFEAFSDTPDVTDGQDQDQIDMVERLPLVAFVETARAQEV